MKIDLVIGLMRLLAWQVLGQGLRVRGLETNYKWMGMSTNLWGQPKEGGSLWWRYRSMCQVRLQTVMGQREGH